jgi:hypothetical protein
MIEKSLSIRIVSILKWPQIITRTENTSTTYSVSKSLSDGALSDSQSPRRTDLSSGNMKDTQVRPAIYLKLMPKVFAGSNKR